MQLRSDSSVLFTSNELQKPRLPTDRHDDLLRRVPQYVIVNMLDSYAVFAMTCALMQFLAVPAYFPCVCQALMGS